MCSSDLMGQSWMGSDFSNKDVARADDIIDQYDHAILSIETVDDMPVYTIESIPHEEAAVVWGSEVLSIRADHVGRNVTTGAEDTVAVHVASVDGEDSVVVHAGSAPPDHDGPVAEEAR